MHHHTENESSLFSCLVLSSSLLSSLLLSCLSSPVFLLSVPSLSLSLSVSGLLYPPCGVVCRVVVLCCGVLCMCAVWCVVCDTLRNPVCPLNTSPCVRSKTSSVCTGTTRTHVSTCVRVVPVQTGTFERTHGDVFSSVKQVLILTFIERLKRMLGSSLIDNFLRTMNGPHVGYHVLQRFTKETLESLPI